MKYFFKPLGHCLTTAVMTSTMLRVYALPVVEAAPPDPALNSQASVEAASTSADAINISQSTSPATSATPITTQGIAPPEVMHSAPSESGSSAQITAPAASIRPTAPTKSPATSTEAGSSPAAEANQAERGIESSSPAKAAPEYPNGKAPAVTSSGHPESHSGGTIAEMRKVLEQRLAAIVQQDQVSREANWQQNVVLSALQSAWAKQFEQARQLAMHPALPADVQTELLGKIAAIETLLNAPIAQQSHPAGPLQAIMPQQLSTGRNVPSGYPVVTAELPSSDVGSVFGKQCPALTNPAAQPSFSDKAPKSAETKANVPALISVLGQNLASQIVQLSQTSIRSDVKPANQPVVAPQLFTGVATSSVNALTKPVVPAESSLQTGMQSESKFQSKSYLQPPDKVPTLPAAQPVQSLGQTAAPDPTTVQAGSTDSISQIMGATLNHSLRRIGISFAQFIPDPLNLAWSWWLEGTSPPAQSSKVAQAQFGVSVLNHNTFVAQPGLGDRPLMQTLEQKLASTLKPLRDVQKLSIPTLSLSKTASAKPAVYDASALMEMNCSMPLAHYDAGSYTIDPAISKQLGWISLMFPLPIPAVITSVFGWRIHPITGNLSFHSGLDMGAPMGTPVLSALPGRVVAAEYMGGYGLAVIVEGNANRERNLYGHLSGIAVQPGAQVKQGTILGWVGSTGNSTGPHLHFETQIRTESGWTAVDPLANAAVAAAKAKP